MTGAALSYDPHVTGVCCSPDSLIALGTYNMAAMPLFPRVSSTPQMLPTTPNDDPSLQGPLLYSGALGGLSHRWIVPLPPYATPDIFFYPSSRNCSCSAAFIALTLFLVSLTN